MDTPERREGAGNRKGYSMADGSGIFSQSGLSEDEAKEIQGYVMTYFIIFLSFAIVAHLLMWIYQPWIHPAAETGAVVEMFGAFMV